MIPLELGGHPSDPQNLWPERWHGKRNAHDKDRVENALKKLVCADKMPLAEAQAKIAIDWVATYHQLFDAIDRAKHAAH